MALSSYKAEDIYRWLPLANNFPPKLAHKYSVCHLFSCDYNKKDAHVLLNVLFKLLMLSDISRLLQSHAFVVEH